MSDRTPPGGGLGPTPEAVEHMLSDVRRALGWLVEDLGRRGLL